MQKLIFHMWSLWNVILLSVIGKNMSYPSLSSWFNMQYIDLIWHYGLVKKINSGSGFASHVRCAKTFYDVILYYNIWIQFVTLEHSMLII